MKMCLVEFLKIFLVKMKTGNNQKIKIIKSRFSSVENTSLILGKMKMSNVILSKYKSTKRLKVNIS